MAMGPTLSRQLAVYSITAEPGGTDQNLGAGSYTDRVDNLHKPIPSPHADVSGDMGHDGSLAG